MIKDKKWMLYGCTGYSGKLIAAECKRVGLTPVLAGRSEAKVKAISDAHGFAYRVFDLTDSARMEECIYDCTLMFNAAGPYTSTCIAGLEACLKQKVHYLSLVGEVPLLDELRGYDQAAQDAGITIGVGLGYDVFPTDCVANILKGKLPDATHLTIAMRGPDSMSAGTAKEMVEQLVDQPFWARQDGKLIASKARTKKIDFGDGPQLAMSISWGDLVSAHHSTGIANIDVFMAADRMQINMISFLSLLRPVLRMKAVRRWINKMIDKKVLGPSEDELQNLPVRLIGEVSNAAGDGVRVSVLTASPYKFTYLGAVHAIQHQIASVAAPGYQTPAQLLGKHAIEAIEGTGGLVFSTSAGHASDTESNQT
jgi:short subunit dehydrogenase-like uncharacterized protein